MIVNLSQAFLNSCLVVPEGKKRLEVCDSVCRGLLVEARSTANAIPTFYLRYKSNGATRYDRLGSIKDLTLAQARKLATLRKAEHSQAEREAPEVNVAQGVITLDVLWKEHYLPQAKLHKRSWKRDEQLYAIRIMPIFGERKLSEISRQDVLKFQNKLAEGELSPASQDHHIKLFRRLLNYAVELELLERNVLKGIKLRLVDNQLHDVATPDQLQRYIEVLRTDKNRPVCNILLFLLSSGSRLGEVQRMTWQQVDMEKGLWFVPASNAKSKKGRTVPLNESALYVLTEAGKMKRSEYVFCNPKTGKPYTTITRVRHKLQALAGVTMRAHSLRHQFADNILAGGGSLYDVQMLLGHSDPRVSQRYGKLSMQALKEASSYGSIIVPKQPEALPPTPTGVAPSQPVESVIPDKEAPSAQIIEFSKAA